MQNNIYKVVFSLFLLFFLDGCFGKKTDISFLEIPKFSQRQISYVPIQPILSGFDSLTDVLAGWDKLIYVVDAKKQTIECYDESLKKLSQTTISGVFKIGQNRALDLYALGTIDTTINNIFYRLPCIYKLDLKNNIYGLSQARIEKKIIHPFYFTTSTPKNSDVNVRFTDITFLADNSYYVSRKGISQDNFIGGPDDAILVFASNDTYISYVQVVTSSEGIKDDYFVSPIAITSFIQPPQTQAIRENLAFAYVSNSPSEPLKVKFILATLNEDGLAYSLDQSLITGDTSKAEGFLYTPSKFGSPSAITASGDGTELIFVADELKDSVFIFTKTGLEGIAAPAASISKKNIKVSFGGAGVFDRISGVAYANKLLYIADNGRNVLFRYKLTTDFE